MSSELAQKFAKTCFTPLEITHFKDVFRTLADTQDGLQFWKEETLCRFLVLPDTLGPGPVIYQMATWLGAFPFPSLAPSILTIEALLKVVVIMTQRYDRVLKRGNADRNKLFFRSLAVFDRRSSVAGDRPVIGNSEKAITEKTASSAHLYSSTQGFSIHQPANDDEEDEDDDELALAALDSLDAIEVFKQDQRADTKINHAQIPTDNFRRLLMLLVVTAPLGAQESLSTHAQRFTEARIEGLRRVVDSIIWAFDPENTATISYRAFNSIIPASLPYMFDGLNPLFEHFLFSKNLDLSKHRSSSASDTPVKQTFRGIGDSELEKSVPLMPSKGEILDLNVLSQLSFFLKGDNVFRRLRPLYLGAEAGFSMSSVGQKVLNWKAPTILLVSGVRLGGSSTGATERSFEDSLPPRRSANSGNGNSKTNRVVYGAYLDKPWKTTNKEAAGSSDCLLFQLEPIHEVFHASTVSKNYMTFSKKGIAFGNPPQRSLASASSSLLELGEVSLTLDPSLEYGVFYHVAAGGGSYLPSQSRKKDWQDRFEVESLEIWGCGGDEEARKQIEAWAFEEREAAARKGMKRGRDIESDRALLEVSNPESPEVNERVLTGNEMAGLIGNHNASGGSMG